MFYPLADSFCQEVPNDSLKIYPMLEIVVTATRNPIPINDSPVRMEVFDYAELQNMNAASVADVLKSSSTIFLNDQGGNASLKTASIRGSASQHLLVLVDGNRFNNMQNGLAYLNMLSLNNVERIEIVHGGNSALYGADALGGVVNIITKHPLVPFKVRTDASIGSFGYNKYLFEGQGRNNKFGVLAGINIENGKDNYPFNYQSDSVGNRTNADFNRKQIYINADAQVQTKSKINLTCQYLKTEFGIPGAINYLTPKARQSDDNVNLLLGYEDMSIDQLEIIVKSGIHYNYEKYDDPDSYFSPNSNHKNIFMNFNPQITYKPVKFQRYIIGAEYSEGSLKSTEFDSKTKRIQRAAYLSSESHFTYEKDFIDKVLIYYTLRYDNISKVGYALTPKLGINVRLFKEGDIRFRSSIGKNFRVPSFNDLYYRGFSNPNLRSEHSISFDAGMLGNVAFYGTHAMELSYFQLNTTDRIVFDLNTFQPENIGKTVSQGIEAKYSWSFLKEIANLGFSYSLTDARKKNKDYDTDSTLNKYLAYIPKNILNINLSLNIQPIGFNLNYNYVDKRFANLDNTKYLPSYNMLNANVIIRQGVALINTLFKLEVNNIFDKSYQVFEDYPMPGRNYRLTLGIEY